MRKVSITLSVFTLLAMLLTACGGQQTSTTIPATNVPPVTVESTATSAPTTTPETTTTAAVPVTGAENPSRMTNELKFSIVDQSGNKLGDVSDMVLDLANTRVSYVVMGASSGSGSVLIPWDSLKLQTGTSSTTTSSAQNAFVLQADPSVLKNAPTIDLTSKMPAMGQAAANWDADIQNYWLSGGSTTTGSGTATSAPATSAPTSAATSAPAVSATSTSTSGTGTGTGTATEAPTSTSGTGTGNATGQAMPVQGVALASQVLGSSVTLSPGQGNGTGTGTGTGTGSATATQAPTRAPTSAATSAPTSTSGTGTGTGKGLGNLQATIDDMIVETNSGMIQYLVIRTAFGGGEVLVPVPVNLVQWDAMSKGFMLNVAPGILQNAPNFTSDQFPDTTTSGWDQQFSTYWQSNGGMSGGSGTGANATATP